MINVTNEIQLTEADRTFINLVQNRITAYGQIPYSIPEQLMIDVIKESARWFYKWYWNATYKTFYKILTTDVLVTLGVTSLQASGFTDYRLMMPSYINVIREVYEADVNSQPTAQELLNNIQLLQMTAPYGNTIAGINNSLYITEACARMIENQNYVSIFSTAVPFHYNNGNHMLSIFKNLTANLLLDVEANVDIQVLYNDSYFIRHVIGRTKQELKRIIGSHTIPLPGEATLNIEEVCNNLEDVEAVETAIKASSGCGDILLMRH